MQQTYEAYQVRRPNCGDIHGTYDTLAEAQAKWKRSLDSATSSDLAWRTRWTKRTK
jgi:hypothetical protein